MSNFWLWSPVEMLGTIPTVTYMSIAPPAKVGLPPKFQSWRSSQEEAIRVMITSPKRVKVISAPTGFGKTAAVIAAALLTKKPTCVVTSTRGLQDQYHREFASIGMVDLRGRRNYQCEMREDHTCEEGYASRCPYKGTIACPSSHAEMKAAASSLVVTNYDKWTSARRMGQGMQHFTQVIFDEGHETYNALAKAMQVTLNYREIEDNLKMSFLRNPHAEDMVNWRDWAAVARVAAETAAKAAQERIAGLPSPKGSWVRHFTHMRNLSRRLATLATAEAKDWVVDEVESGYQFDPIRPGKYAEAALLLKVPSVIVVSATVRPKTMFMIGQAKDQFEFVEFKSEFDPRRWPLYYTPTMRVDKNHPDLRMLWLKLDQIAGRRRDRKGIIHTISYTRRDEVLNASRFSDDMIINPKGEAPSDTIEEFREAGPGTILVSPSVGTGYDFPMSDAEWQFVCKIPFPDSRSKIIQARQNADPEYGAFSAMQTLVQIVGRGMRSKPDQCETFIGDEHLSWFLPRFGHLAPKSFHGCFRKVDILPAPPPRL